MLIVEGGFMKISNVSTMVMGTPWRNLLFVKVETDDGLVGWAEARPVGGVGPVIGYLNESVPEFALGRDPFNTEAMCYRMLRETYGRAGEIAMTGIALLEIACWDIIGKALDQPVYRLLGGAFRDKIKAYANGWYRVERRPEAWHAAATEVVDMGYRALKFDPFGSGFYEFTREEKLLSIALVEAVYDAVGPDVELLIEMHGRFNPVTAVEIIRDLAEFKPGWVEEPVPPENLRALRDVREVALGLGIPVATGERIHTPYEYRELFELNAADIIQTDTTHFGGILNMKKLAATAEMHYVLVAPHKCRRSLLDDGVAGGGGDHAQLQDPGILQRLCRPAGQGSRRRHARGGRRLFLAAREAGAGRRHRRRRHRRASPARG